MHERSRDELESIPRSMNMTLMTMNMAKDMDANMN